MKSIDDISYKVWKDGFTKEKDEIHEVLAVSVGRKIAVVFTKFGIKQQLEGELEYSGTGRYALRMGDLLTGIEKLRFTEESIFSVARNFYSSEKLFILHLS